MEILLAASVIFGFLALIFLIRLLGSLRRGRLIRAGGNGLTFLATSAASAAAALVIFNYVSYNRLTSEEQISQIEFRRIGDNEYHARLMIEGEHDQFFRLRGDEWQLDARIVNWNAPATILGLDPLYRLERISGRFSSIDDERSEERTVHEVEGAPVADLWAIANRFPVIAPGVDAYYGSATFVPMADGARYSVSLTRDALIARPANEKARQAVGDWTPPQEIGER